MAIGGYEKAKDGKRKPFMVLEFHNTTGVGGGPNRDGQDGALFAIGNLANTPMELIEAEGPVRFREYGFEGTSPGYRGALGMVREYEFSADEATVQVRSDRETNPPRRRQRVCRLLRRPRGAAAWACASGGDAGGRCEAVAIGSQFGANHPLEVRWAEQVVMKLVPSVERVRFTSSGTEATHMALRLARDFTGKSKIVRFRTHFHGWHDHMTLGVTNPSRLQRRRAAACRRERALAASRTTWRPLARCWMPTTTSPR